MKNKQALGHTYIGRSIVTSIMQKPQVRHLRKYLPSFALGALITLLSLSPVLIAQDAKASNKVGGNASREALPSISDVADQLLPTVVSIQTTSYIQSRQPDMSGSDLFEFFMVFVVLCGVASALLFMLVPKLKKMMHGIN